MAKKFKEYIASPKKVDKHLANGYKMVKELRDGNFLLRKEIKGGDE